MVTTRTSAFRRTRACSATTPRVVYSLLQIIAFVGVLWALSAQVIFQVAGYDIAIPGYMVWCALAYALIGSGLTWLVGRPLIALNGERYAREAEFRFALVRVNESGESIALHGGEKDEHRHLEAALAAVIDTMRRISSSRPLRSWSPVSWRRTRCWRSAAHDELQLAPRKADVALAHA